MRVNVNVMSTLPTYISANGLSIGASGWISSSMGASRETFVSICKRKSQHLPRKNGYVPAASGMSCENLAILEARAGKSRDCKAPRVSKMAYYRTCEWSAPRKFCLEARTKNLMNAK